MINDGERKKIVRFSLVFMLSFLSRFTHNVHATNSDVSKPHSANSDAR